MLEFRELLRVMDIPLKSEDEAWGLFQEVDANQDNMISFEELKDMMMRQTFNKLHHERYHKKETEKEKNKDGFLMLNRYSVALSLEEAECVRGVIHMMNGKDIIGGSDAAIGLRINASIFKRQKQKSENSHKRRKRKKLKKIEKKVNIVLNSKPIVFHFTLLP